jgi:hypothetical protein
MLSGQEGPRGVAELHILWLCPVLMTTIPPTDLPQGVEFHKCHNLYDLDELLEPLESPRFDAIVVDTTRAERGGYDPVDMVAEAAGKCAKPPRFLLAVVMPGITDDPLDSQTAFAVEMQSLWSRNKPVLSVEGAVRYHLEQRPVRIKENTVRQERRWGDVADRAVKLLNGELPVEPPSVSPLTIAFVVGMCAKSRRSVTAYFNDSQRNLLFQLAQQRLSVRGLAEKLSHDPAYIRRLQAQIAGQLAPYMLQPGDPSGRPNHAEFCDGLVERYRPWLLSRYKRVSCPSSRDA